MRWFVCSAWVVLLGCPKDPVVVEIPGRACLVRLQLTEVPGVAALQSDLPGDEGRFSAIDLVLTRGDERLERRLLGGEADGDVVRFAEPITFNEGDRFDLTLLVRSPSGRVFSIGRRSNVGCGASENEREVILPMIPVNRWVTLSAPELQRFGHRSMGIGSGALFVGGRRTPQYFAAPGSDAGPQDAGVPADASGLSDAGPGSQPDAGVVTDAGPGVPDGALVDAGPELDAGTSVDGGAASDAGPSPDAGPTQGCTPSPTDQLLGEPVQASIVYFDRFKLSFQDEFETSGRRDLTQIPRLMGSALYHQEERQRVLLVGGLSVVGPGACDPPPAQFHLFDYSDAAMPRLSSLTWGDDQARNGHLALQRLAFSRAVPVDHDLMDLVLVGGYRGRSQVAPDADWPPRHDPPSVSIPHRMAVINASNFVSRRDVLRAPWTGGGDLRLPFMPSVTAFGDGSALVLGGWAVDANGISGSSDEVYHLLRSNQADNVELEAPHLYAGPSLAKARAGAQALRISDRLVLVMGGLEAAPTSGVALELYGWTPGGRAGFREGGTLARYDVRVVGQGQIWDRGFTAVTLPCTGSAPCPVLVVGGQTQTNAASNRALLLTTEQVDNNGQLVWQVTAEPFAHALPGPRWGATLTILDDGSYLVAGGRTAPPGAGGGLAGEAYVYVPYSED